MVAAAKDEDRGTEEDEDAGRTTQQKLPPAPLTTAAASGRNKEVDNLEEAESIVLIVV